MFFLNKVVWSFDCRLFFYFFIGPVVSGERREALKSPPSRAYYRNTPVGCGLKDLLTTNPFGVSIAARPGLRSRRRQPSAKNCLCTVHRQTVPVHRRLALHQFIARSSVQHSMQGCNQGKGHSDHGPSLEAGGPLRPKAPPAGRPLWLMVG